jgi:membrane protease YdiL (CAAX protease family)
MSWRAVRPSLEEPYLLFLIFVGIGIGTVLLDPPVRLTLLWVTLAILTILYCGKQPINVAFTLGNVAKGALLGLIIAAPLLAFLSGQVRVFTERLYGTHNTLLLFYQICLVSAPIEEAFFRGVVQQHKGSSASIALYAATALLYFLPHVPLLAAFIVFVAMGVLGIVYSSVCERYGLAASIASHVVIGFVLQVIPSLWSSLTGILG